MCNKFLDSSRSMCSGLNKDFAESSAPMTTNKMSADNTAKIQQQLDGAILSAWNSVNSNSKPPTLTRTRWIWRLAGSYHLCHSTSQLMAAAAQRFAASGRESLATWAAKKALEERGRDQLALLDIEAMGYDAEAVVGAFYPAVAKALIDYFTQSVQSPDPIRCVGCIYAIERLGLVNKKEYIQAVEVLLPPSTRDRRYPRVHSSIGVGVERVKGAGEMLAGLTFEENTRITIACYETTLLCLSPSQEAYISDEELQNVLSSLESHSRIKVKSDFYSPNRLSKN